MQRLGADHGAEPPYDHGVETGRIDDDGTGDDSVAVLSRAADFGAYFATERWRPDAGWRSLDDLADPAVLDAEVDRTTRALGGRVEPRVAASTLHLGLVAKITAPLLGAAVATALLPQLTTDSVWWRVRSNGPLRIATSPVPVLPASSQRLGRLIEALTAGLCDAVGERYAVSPQVLWGNVGSSLSAAARVIGDRDGVHDLTAGALRVGRLRGTIDQHGIRRSCCLFYRAPGGGYCGDCVLTTR